MSAQNVHMNLSTGSCFDWHAKPTDTFEYQHIPSPKQGRIYFLVFLSFAEVLVPAAFVVAALVLVAAAFFFGSASSSNSMAISAVSPKQTEVFIAAGTFWNLE